MAYAVMSAVRKKSVYEENVYGEQTESSGSFGSGALYFIGNFVPMKQKRSAGIALRRR